MANQLIGTNVEARIENNKLIIEVDLTQDHGPSTTGKTNVIATTAGSRAIPTEFGTVLVGVNVNKKIVR